MKFLASWLAAFPLAFCVSAPCVAATYTVTDLGTLGGNSSLGYGINAKGQVTGYSGTLGNVDRAFVYDGSMHDIGTLAGSLGGYLSDGSDINNSGWVTGESYTTGLDVHAFLYDGTMHDLGTLGGTFSGGSAINNNGLVAGGSSTLFGQHAFLYDGTMHDLGTLGGTNSYAGDINDRGWVTGQSDLAEGGSHAFLYDGLMHDLGTVPGGTSSAGISINANGLVTGYCDMATANNESLSHAFLYDGTMHDIGTLGGTFSAGQGINASGHVTGIADLPGHADVHAFLYDTLHGMVDLNSLIDPSSGWDLKSGSAINDTGQIAGFGTIGGATHAFLLTPIPEPSGLVLAAVGALGLVAWIWRRGQPRPASPAASDRRRKGVV